MIRGPDADNQLTAVQVRKLKQAGTPAELIDTEWPA
jgi:hypothetical protein